MQRAIRIVRSRAAEWHIAPDKIGVMGFSAGGHLASTASTQFDRGNASAADAIDRARQPPRFRDSRLSGDHAFRSVDASGIENDASWRERRGRRPAAFRPIRSCPARRRRPFCSTRTRTRLSLWKTASIIFSPSGRPSIQAQMHIFKDGPHGVGMPMNDTVTCRVAQECSRNWMRASGFL